MIVPVLLSVRVTAASQLAGTLNVVVQMVVDKKL